MAEKLDAYLIFDHQAANDLIRSLLNAGTKRDRSKLYELINSVTRHIYIEEAILFPGLMDQMQEDIDYLEREHGKIIRLLSLIGDPLRGAETRANLLQLLDILIEHNSFEESFVYDRLEGFDANIVDKIRSAPDGWKCKYC
ncbi:MAG: hemerythrin domain-containing protein [Thermoplasmataceae archaeon]